MVCGCGGNHHKSQHDRQARLIRQLDKKESTMSYHNDYNPQPAAVATGVLRCQHNENGEFVERDGSPQPHCNNDASFLVTWETPESGNVGKPNTQYICEDDPDHLTLLTDSLVTVDPSVRVFKLVDVSVLVNG